MKTPEPSISTVDPLPEPRRRRWPFVLLGVVLLVFVLPFAIVAWRLDAWVEGYRAEAVPQLEKRLGRKVEIGRIDVRVFGGIGAELRNVAIGPGPEEGAPLLTLSRAAVDLGVMRTLLTLGRRPALDAFEVSGLTMNVIRFPDGTTNVERLLTHLEETAPEKKPAEPLDDATRARVRHARLGRLRISDVRIAFTDLARGGAKAEISDLDISADGVGLAESWSLALSAAVLRAEKNLDIRGRFLPAPELPGGIGAPRVGGITINMAETNVAPLLPFLGAAASGGLATLEAAALSADLAVETAPTGDKARGGLTAKGGVALAGLRFPRGTPFDARLDVDARVDADRGDVELGRLTASLGEMAVEARGKLFALRTAPRFEAFRLTSRALDFDTLRKHYPALDESAGVRLGGPFSIEGAASGETGKQQFEGRVDLSAASLEVPALFRKPAGTTLALSTRGSAEGSTLTLERLLLELVDWRLLAQGVVKELNTEAPAFDLSARTEAPSLGGVLRLLPPVAKAVPGGRLLGGALEVVATAKGTPKALVANVRATLAGLDVRVPDALLRGGGDALVRAELGGEGSAARLKAQITVNLDKLEAIYTDVLRKTAGTPLSLKLDVDQRGPRSSQTFDVQVAGMRATGKATLESRGRAQLFDVTALAEPFSLPAVLALVPSAQPEGIGALRVGGTVHARGTSGKPETMQVDLPSFTAAAGKSDLRGKLSFRNPERPVVDLEASSKYLDLDDFLPPPPTGAKAPTKGAAAPRAGDAPETPAGDSALARVTGQARLAVERGRAERIDYQNLKADLRLASGRAVARTLEVDAFGGHFSGSGTELPLIGRREPFAFKGKLTNLDVDAVLTRFADTPGLLRGRLSANADLAGRGTAVEDLQKSLAGLLAGELANAEFVPGTLLGGLRAPLAKAVEIPTLSKLLGGAQTKLDPAREKALGDLDTAVRFDAGAMKLSKPLAANTPHGPLSLDGRILLDGKADLGGTWTLSPEAASALVGNRFKVDQAVPVRLRLSGALRSPSVAITNATEVAKIFAVAFGRSTAGQALEQGARRGVEAAADRLGLKDKLPGGGGAGAAEEAKRGEEEARQRAAEAEQKAKAEADRLRAEAADRRQRAEDEARRRADEAKKGAQEKLKGIFNR